jgi:hypothetical protein
MRRRLILILGAAPVAAMLAGLSPVLVRFPEDGELSPDLFNDIDGLVHEPR